MKKYWLLVAIAYLIFFIFTPPLATPDENDHYETVYWLSRGIYPHQPTSRKLIKPRFTSELFDLFDLQMTNPRRNLILPDFKAIAESPLKQKRFYTPAQEAKFIPVTLQSYQTPLYHLTAAIVFRFGRLLGLNLSVLFYFTRLTSAGFYFALIYLALKTLRLFFARTTATNLWLFFSLNPQLLRSGLSINPDIGNACFGLLFLYLLLKQSKHAVYLFLAAGATALAKFSGVFTMPVYNLWVLIQKTAWREKFNKLLIFNLLFGLMLLPWFYLNYSRYGTTSTTRGFYIASGHQLTPRPALTSAVLAATEFRHTLMHFSGFLGASNDRYPFKPFFVLYTVVVVILGLLGLSKFWRTKSRFRVPVVVFAGFYLAFLYSLSFFFKKTGMDWDIQGRYFLNGFFLLTLFLGYVVSNRILAYFALWHYLFILFFVLIPGYYV